MLGVVATSHPSDVFIGFFGACYCLLISAWVISMKLGADVIPAPITSIEYFPGFVISALRVKLTVSLAVGPPPTATELQWLVLP